MRAAPAVSCARCAKNAHTSIQVQRKHSGIPCAMVLRLMARSSRRRIRLVTVAGGLTVLRSRLGHQNLRRLDTSNGCQNHTLLPYAAARLRQPPWSEVGLRRVKKLSRARRRSSCAPCLAHGKPPCEHPRANAAASTASRPTFVTMANAPLLDGMREVVELICPTR